jgi:hypothetical protein
MSMRNCVELKRLALLLHELGRGHAECTSGPSLSPLPRFATRAPKGMGADPPELAPSCYDGYLQGVGQGTKWPHWYRMVRTIICFTPILFCLSPHGITRRVPSP